MGLLLNITDDKGVTLCYHRIERVIINSEGKARFRVLSYTSEKQRDEEKTLIASAKEREEKIRKIEETKGDNEELIEELEQIESPVQLKETWVKDSWYGFEDVDVDKGLNYKTAYEMLKTLEDFKDAKDAK